MRRLSSRAPSMRWAGASEETIQLSTAAPMVEPIMPPMAAPEKPRIVPPKPPPIVAPTEARRRVAIVGGFQMLGMRKAKAMRRRQACVRGSSITPSRS